MLPSRSEITQVYGGLPRNQGFLFFFIVACSQVQLKHSFVKRKLMGFLSCYQVNECVIGATSVRAFISESA